MTIDEARTIWLTIIGTDWVRHYDLMVDPQFDAVIRPAYTVLRMNACMDVDRVRECVKIKCES